MKWIMEQWRILKIGIQIIKYDIVTIEENGGYTETYKSRNNGSWMNTENNQIISDRALCITLIMLPPIHYKITYSKEEIQC